MTWIKKISEFNGSLKRYVDPSFDASVISTGTIDSARLPPSAGVIVASGDITSLTTDQQTEIITGTKVILASGAAYYYKGSGSKTSLASYIAESAVVAWSGVTSKPDAVTSIGALTPVANFIAYYTGAASAALTSLTAFGRSLMGLADASAARALISCLPINNPTATGTITAPDVAGGLARMQTSAVNPSNQAWFGYVGLNSAGSYVGYYPGSDGAIRIAAATGQLVSIGTGAAYGQLVISDSGVASSSMAGTGDRPALVDSTGKFKPDPRAGVQSGSGAIAINASTKRMLRVTGAASLQLGSPASCAEVTVEVTAAFNGDIGITGEHEYCDTSPAYWYYSSTGRTVTVGNFGSDGLLRKFTLSCDGVHWYFKG